MSNCRHRKHRLNRDAGNDVTMPFRSCAVGAVSRLGHVQFLPGIAGALDCRVPQSSLVDETIKEFSVDFL